MTGLKANTERNRRVGTRQWQIYSILCLPPSENESHARIKDVKWEMVPYGTTNEGLKYKPRLLGKRWSGEELERKYVQNRMMGFKNVRYSNELETLFSGEKILRLWLGVQRVYKYVYCICTGWTWKFIWLKRLKHWFECQLRLETDHAVSKCEMKGMMAFRWRQFQGPPPPPPPPSPTSPSGSPAFLSCWILVAKFTDWSQCPD